MVRKELIFILAIHSPHNQASEVSARIDGSWSPMGRSGAFSRLLDGFLRFIGIKERDRGKTHDGANLLNPSWPNCGLDWPDIPKNPNNDTYLKHFLCHWWLICNYPIPKTIRITDKFKTGQKLAIGDKFFCRIITPCFMALVPLN